MSTAANPFEIEIRFQNVPDRMVGVPLPVELVSPGGFVRPVVLTVAEDRPVTTPVAAPGRYLIRAELPSGGWVAQVANVPDEPDSPDRSPATAILDLDVAAPAAAIPAPVPEPSPSRIGEVWNKFTYVCGPVFEYVGLSSPGARLEFGWFAEWGEDTPEGIDLQLAQQATEPRRVNLPASVSLRPHPGWSDFRLVVRPLLVYCRIEGVDTHSRRALIAWPPGSGDEPLRVELSDGPRNPDAPPILASTATGDRMVDALFAYIGTGALASAREASKPLLDRAVQFLEEKHEDPVRACLAAYTLLRVGTIEHPQWLANLANRFPHLPDGDVANAWYLLREGDAKSAREYFHRALAKGVPMYSEGLRLLRDGLNFVSGLFDDAQVKADAARANALASIANLDSKLTCLAVGKRLQVKWRDVGAPAP